MRTTQRHDLQEPNNLSNRQRFVGDGFLEEVVVMNHDSSACEFELRVEADADFADLFEVKDALPKKGEHYREDRDGRLILGY